MQGAAADPASEKQGQTNPWLIILIVAPLPFLLLGFLFYKWSTARSSYQRIASQMVQRQNSVLAYDAVVLAREVSHLLETEGRDAEALALIPPTPVNLTKFYLSRVSQVTQIDPRDDSISVVPMPMYNELSVLDLHGNELIRLTNGKVEEHLRTFSECRQRDLCDADLLRRAMALHEGELYYGRLMRWYSPQGAPEIFAGATFPVAYRTLKRIIIVGLDYHFFKNLLTEPTFPYESKRDLLQSYANGNYIYLVDDEGNMLAHPKYWHVMGIDQSSGKWVSPMKTDADEGKHPLNVEQYEGVRLRDYFSRLTRRSFLQKSVDIFEASNLGGTNRVLSVAPILLSKGQFQKSGVFGHVILGCSVDYFEEPREQYVPYY